MQKCESDGKKEIKEKNKKENIIIPIKIKK